MNQGTKEAATRSLEDDDIVTKRADVHSGPAEIRKDVGQIDINLRKDVGQIDINLRD